MPVSFQRMWSDCLFHVCGQHEWLTGECIHSELALSETDGDKPTLVPDTPVWHALRDVVRSDKLLSEMHYYVDFM